MGTPTPASSPSGGVAAASWGSGASAGDRARVVAVSLGDAPARGRAAPGRSLGPPACRVPPRQTPVGRSPSARESLDAGDPKAGMTARGDADPGAHEAGAVPVECQQGFTARERAGRRPPWPNL